MRLVLPMKLLLAVLLAACVTVNVYFPAAAAQTAADQVIDQSTKGTACCPTPGLQPEPASGLHCRSADHARLPATPNPGPLRCSRRARYVLNALVPAAHAQAEANLDINTPETRAIIASMAARFPQLTPYFNSGRSGTPRTATSTSGTLMRSRCRSAPVKTLGRRGQQATATRLCRGGEGQRPSWSGRTTSRTTFARRWIASGAGRPRGIRKAEPGSRSKRVPPPLQKKAAPDASRRRFVFRLEACVQGHFAGDTDLVGEDPALEEVGDFLDVLQIHEAERVAGAVAPVAGPA